MKYFLSALSLLVPLAGNAYAMSQQGCGGDCSGCHSLTVKEANTLLKGMGEVKKVNAAAVRGLWELDFVKDGKRAVAYMDYSKKHIMPGPVFSLATRAPIAKAAETKPAPPAKVKVSSIPLTNSVIMGNPAAKKKLFVFTDPDCPFCSKLHTELKKLVESDKKLAVYVKLFPLKMHPNAYDKSRAIMSGDANKLLDDAFSGAKLPAPAADAGKGVDETVRLAQSLGIKATPTLVLPDGRVMPGYREAAEIRKLLAGKK